MNTSFVSLEVTATAEALAAMEGLVMAGLVFLEVTISGELFATIQMGASVTACCFGWTRSVFAGR